MARLRPSRLPKARFTLHQTLADVEVVPPIYPRFCVCVTEGGVAKTTSFAGCCTDAKGVGIEQALFGANYEIGQDMQFTAPGSKTDV